MDADDPEQTSKPSQSAGSDSLALWMIGSELGWQSTKTRWNQVELASVHPHRSEPMKTIWCGSTLAAITFFTVAPELGIRSSVAGDMCVQLTRAEFPQSRRRAGTANDCSIEGAYYTARNRARDNATNALDQVCTNGITQAIAGRACTRVGMVVNTSAFFIIPPLASFHSQGDSQKYIGHGIGDAAAMNLCVIVEDLSMDVGDHVFDANCFFSLTKFSATARARSRCAVVCTTQ
jgi:hypothetical protein